jgi:tRNA pseudouridine13 synthase
LHSIPDWARALGAPPVSAAIRSRPADFVVEEQLAIEFSEDGEHDWLWIEKTGANTNWVAGRLARHAGIPERDVGYAGLKDRHAITSQWFSVRRAADTDWTAFSAEGVRILECRRHRRKLQRGAHTGNRFRIALRGTAVATSAALLEERLEAVAVAGVPNYFGEQRFGRDGGNISLALALFAGRRLARHQRSMALSAARSLVFNAVLDERVRNGSWNRILPGDLANLDGSGSIFAVAEVDAELERRCALQDIHPTATLWGAGAPLAAGRAAEIETAVAAQWTDIVRGLERAGLKAAARPLRLPVRGLAWAFEDDALWVEFELGSGAFATAVLREIARTDDAL